MNFKAASFFLFPSSGATACVKLNQFEEAIRWCDKGLAVSLIAISKRGIKYLKIFAIHKKATVPLSNPVFIRTFLRFSPLPYKYTII